MAERTLCLIKPDAVGQPWGETILSKNDEDEVVEVQEVRAADKSVEIINRITASGLSIAQQKTCRITAQQAREFYGPDAGSPGFGDKCSFLASGLLVALVLEGDNAIARLQELLGPADSEEARAASAAAHPLNEDLWTIRASFGTDALRNAAHGSADAFNALRELEQFFPAAARYERTLAVIKSDVVNEGKEAVAGVLQEIEEAGFLVIAQTEAKIDEGTAQALYSDRAGSAGHAALVASAVGDAVAVIIERQNAVKAWALRAGTNTGLHASASEAAAVREAGLFFTLPLPVERTLALIKPGVADKNASDIKRMITANGFTILQERRVTLAREHAEAFYAEHTGKFFFGPLTRYMSSGSLVALVLAKPAAIKCWRTLLGPTSPDKARAEAPGSVRALYGVANERNAGHGSDSAASAAREIRFFFPDFSAASLLTGADARAYVRDSPVADVFGAGGSVPATLTSVLVRGLTELCKARPAGLSAVGWLGKWLLDNNPRTGRVALGEGAQEGVVGDVGSAAGAGAASSAGISVEVLETKMNEDPASVVPAKVSVVFLLGGPGSGRTTLAQQVGKSFGYEVLNTGELLRAEARAGTALGREIAAVMEAGQLVNDTTVLALLKQAMKKSGGRRFLLDGFPRTLPQAFAFEQSVAQPSFVVHLEASEETMRARVADRAGSSGRADDASSAFAARLEGYSSFTAGVAEFYGKVGLLRGVDASGNADDTFAAASPAFEPEVVFVLGGPGAGKTTQCRAAAAAQGYVHLSTGELLGAEAGSGSRLGEQVKAHIKRGELVPLAVTMQVLRRAIDANPGARFLIDGFPRTLEQAAAFRATVGPARAVLNITVSEATSRRRLPRAGAASLARRLRVYANATAAVLDSYRQAGLVTDISGEGGRGVVGRAVAAALAPRVVFVLGGPGSGKGTQCARLKREFGYAHLSVGDLLRAEVARNSPDGAMISRMIGSGQIVPIRVTLGLLRSAMINSGRSRFLIDGFPRAMDQVAPFAQTVGQPSFVLFFDLSPEEMRARMAVRQRADDNEEAIAKRLRTFRETSFPVVEAFARAGKVVRVDASGSVEEVYAAARSQFAASTVFITGEAGVVDPAAAAAAAAKAAAAGGDDEDEEGEGKAAGAGLGGVPAGAMTEEQVTQLREALAAAVAARHDYRQLSVAGLMEYEVASGGPQAEAASEALALGERPAALAAGLVHAAIARSGAERVVVSDFPNSAEEVAAYTALGGCLDAALHVSYPGEGSELVTALAGAEGAAATFTHAPTPAQARAAFRPQIALLAGAAGSGRGEFAKRAGIRLGYHHIRVTQLLNAEAAAGSQDGKAIAKAMAAGRTAPVDATLRLIRREITGSRANKFLLDGFPRLVSAGYPGVHDQLFALEEQVGPVSSLVALQAAHEDRVSRTGGAPTQGARAALDRSVDAFDRQKMPVFDFLSKLGKAVLVDTTNKDPDAVFEEASGSL